MLVELARISDARLVARAIAGRSGLSERRGRRARGAARVPAQPAGVAAARQLRARAVARHRSSASCSLAHPRVMVLVTSRAALDIPEERVYPVPALELPDPSRRTSAARLRRTEAIRLFVDRAQAARPDFELSEDERAVGRRAVRAPGRSSVRARARRRAINAALATRVARTSRLEARPACAQLPARA